MINPGSHSGKLGAGVQPVFCAFQSFTIAVGTERCWKGARQPPAYSNSGGGLDFIVGFLRCGGVDGGGEGGWAKRAGKKTERRCPNRVRRHRLEKSLCTTSGMLAHLTWFLLLHL